MAYLAGNQAGLSQRAGRYLIGFFVLGGVLSMMLALGLFISLISVSIGRVLSYAIPISDLAIIALGGLLVFNLNPLKGLPQIRVPVLSHPFVNAYVYGLLYGPLTLPCSGPLAVGIFAYSFTLGEALSKFGVFFWYGVGFGLPLLVLSLLSGGAQRWLTRLFARHARLINLIAGLLLIGIGLYDLIANRAMLAHFFLK